MTKRLAHQHEWRGGKHRWDPTQLLTRFLAAWDNGQLDDLTGLLAEEVTFWSDGGGKARAAIRPVHGQAHVARFLLGLRRFRTPHTHVTFAEVNGAVAIVLWEGETLIGVMNFVTNGERIYEVRNVLNPDKLAHVRIKREA